MASAVAANAIGAWFAIVLGLAVGGGILWFAFSLLRRISRLESDAEPPSQQERPGRDDDVT